MDTIGKRVRAVRTTLGLTLEKFGERLGLKKSTLSNIENERYGVTEQLAKSICREFNVDYLWLMTGEGSMFLELDKDSEYARYTDDLLADTDSVTADFIKNFIVAYYSKMDDASRKIFDNVVKDTLAGFEDKKKEEL